MVLCLGLITLVASAGLALVYDVTKGPIEAAKQGKTTGALSTVIEEFDNDPTTEATALELDGMPIKVYTGLKGGKPSGYAVETMTKAGFSGEIRMMVGFRPDGEIYNIEVLQQNETPGLGSKMADPDNPLVLSFKGKNPADMKMSVTKDGGDVDAITASTISSRAYVDAVARAYAAFRSVAFGEAATGIGQPDAAAGATTGHVDGEAGATAADGGTSATTEQPDSEARATEAQSGNNTAEDGQAATTETNEKGEGNE